MHLFLKNCIGNFDFCMDFELFFLVNFWLTCVIHFFHKWSSHIDDVDNDLSCPFQVINLNRELEELQDQLADSDRVRKSQAAELEEVMSSKDDVGKNVSPLRSTWNVSNLGCISALDVTNRFAFARMWSLFSEKI